MKSEIVEFCIVTNGVLRIVKNYLFIYLFFFFQAEDGIRDHCVTGVQTCALPIWLCVILIPTLT